MMSIVHLPLLSTNLSTAGAKTLVAVLICIWHSTATKALFSCLHHFVYDMPINYILATATLIKIIFLVVLDNKFL